MNRSGLCASHRRSLLRDAAVVKNSFAFAAENIAEAKAEWKVCPDSASEYLISLRANIRKRSRMSRLSLSYSDPSGFLLARKRPAPAFQTSNSYTASGAAMNET